MTAARTVHWWGVLIALALTCFSVSAVSIKPLALLQQRVVQAGALAENPQCEEKSSTLTKLTDLIDQQIACHSILDSAGTKWKLHGLKREPIFMNSLKKINFEQEWLKEASPDACMVKCNEISAGKHANEIKWPDGKAEPCNTIIFKLTEADGSTQCQFFTTAIVTTESWALSKHGQEDIAYRAESQGEALGQAQGAGGPGQYEVPVGGNLDIVTTVNIKS